MDLMKLFQAFREGVKGGYCALVVDDYAGTPAIRLEWRIRAAKVWGFNYALHRQEMLLPAELVGADAAARARAAFERDHPTVREQQPAGYSDTY